MSSSIELKSEAAAWRDELAEFLESYRSREPLPTSDELDELQHEQRRISGGSLMQFLQFVQNEAIFEAFPILDDQPIERRVFVFATDASGVAAARDLLEPDSERAFVVTKQEWRAWLEDPSCDEDEHYEKHYQCWSVWHRNFQANWQIPEDGDREGEYWVHEEGFAVADRAGRGAEHIWCWDGEELDLVEQSADRWTSSPPRQADD